MSRVSQLLEAGKLADGVDLLRAVATSVPDMVGVQVLLAETLEKLGENKEAVDYWRRAQILVPNGPAIMDALNRLGVEQSEALPEELSEPDTEVAQSTWERSDSTLDLDTLISGLQRRDPLEEISDDVDPEPSASEQADDVATLTLAHIFESQKHFDEAVKIYDLLADREEDAGRASALRAQAEDLRRRISQS